MPEGHSLTEIARLAGVTPRTVRYYIGQGLLRPAARTGTGATYDDDQLRRLLLIRRLQRQHLPLAEIRSRLAQLDPAEVSELVAEPEEATARSSALEYIRRHLAPGVPASVPTAALATPKAEAGRAMRYLALHRSPVAAAEASRAATPSTDPRLATAALALSVAAPLASPTAAEPAGPEARGEMRSTWERIELTADIELHVRRPLDRRGNRIVDQILNHARDLLAAD